MTSTPEELDDVAVAELFTRCGAAALKLVNGVSDGIDLDATIADLYRLPPDLPATAHIAANLLTVVLRGSPDGSMRYLRHVGGLLAIADRHPPATPHWPQLRAVAEATAVMRARLDGEGADPRAVLKELDRVIDPSVDDQAQHALRAMRSGLQYIHALDQGDQAALRQMPIDVEDIENQFGQGSPQASTAELLRDLLGFQMANQSGDDAAMWQLIERMRTMTERLMPGSDLRASMEDALMLADVVNPASVDGYPAETRRLRLDDATAHFRARAQRPGATDGELAMYHMMTGFLEFDGGNETEHDRMDAGMESLRRAVTVATAGGDSQQIFHLVSLVMGLVRRSEVTGNSADLAEACELLERARELAGGPDHALWAQINEMLAYVRRRRGDTPSARQTALEGLRRHAWNVLLQSDPAAAAAAIRDAAQDAFSLAESCLADNAPADAVQALDACRGLMLFAATEFRDVVTRLNALGCAELADRWRAATASTETGGPSMELRREVLTALTRDADPRTGGARLLLDPPSIGEIRAALAALDTDALVYLMPGTPPSPGWAVMVAADGPLAFMALPNLLLDDDVDVEAHLAVVSSRELELARSAAAVRDLGVVTDADVSTSLDALCDWAWRAAIGPLLERYLPTLPEPAGRPRRVVLVPVGNLARIPWQAARRNDGTYAVQLAAFSQAASARMLCRSAARAPVPITPVGLIVGDPDTAGAAAPLVAARIEAQAIHETFYRGARYVGQMATGSTSRSGAGSAEEVRAWLTTMRPGAGAMLHLACHGVVQPAVDDTTSYLLLAGADRLTAEELVGVMDRAPDRAIGLVVLAACRTGVSGRGYDEAYSLGTAFLAGGARSVLSTQWSVPDRATSVLMFMFHHYLVGERRPAWEALRRAQLWMLDPDRTPPRQMPPLLVQSLPDAAPERVVAWAGFVHWGQ